MTFRPAAAIAAATLALAGASPASAALVTLDFNLLATDFVGPPGAPPTPGTVTGRFQLAFDNAGDIARTTTGLTVTGFNLGYGVKYAYSAADDILSIATIPIPGSYIFATNTFGFLVTDASGDYAGDDFQYALAQSPFRANVLQLTRLDTPPGPAAVPEPATWALLIAGFGLAGAALRGRARPSAA